MIAMNAVARIKAEVAAEQLRDDRLAQQIAQFLADQNNDHVVKFYTDQANEIMAMVRESDRAARVSG